jgi:hypothetical protein
VRVEALIVEVGNGRNVVVVRAAVPRCAHVEKWSNRLRAAWEDNSLNPPCCGRLRVAGGGLGQRRGAVDRGASFWRSGKANGRRRCAWRCRRWKKRRSARSRETQGRGGEMVWSLCRLGPGARGRASCPGRHISGPNLRPEWVRADVFERGMVVCVGGLEMT